MGQVAARFVAARPAIWQIHAPLALRNYAHIWPKSNGLQSSALLLPSTPPAKGRILMREDRLAGFMARLQAVWMLWLGVQPLGIVMVVIKIGKSHHEYIHTHNVAHKVRLARSDDFVANRVNSIYLLARTRDCGLRVRFANVDNVPANGSCMIDSNLMRNGIYFTTSFCSPLNLHLSLCRSRL